MPPKNCLKINVTFSVPSRKNIIYVVMLKSASAPYQFDGLFSNDAKNSFYI